MKLEVGHGNEKAIQPGIQAEAVRLVKDRGISVPQAVRDLDVHENVLRKWVRELAAEVAPVV
jgi:transposase